MAASSFFKAGLSRKSKLAKMKKIFVILPAYNEAEVISQVITKAKKALSQLEGYETHFVVIDDGSTDNTSKEAGTSGVVVLRHVLNRGLGGALGTGLAYAKENGADILVTIDSDGQHDPKDIIKALKPLEKDEADVVIGSRLLGQKGMPWDRIIISWAGSLITFFLFGLWTSDSQSGFRIFNKKAIESIEIRTQGMEVSSELFGEIEKHYLRFVEVPIRVIYTDYSRRKGQPNINSFQVLLKLVLRIFR